MKSYRTLATVRLFTGRVFLTDDQVKWRANCLKKVKDEVYEIVDGVTFKAGEVIGLEDPPKPYRKVLESLEPEKQESPGLEVEVQEAVEFAEKPTVKKRKYTKRKA